MIALALFLQTIDPVARGAACTALVRSDPVAAERSANEWLSGGWRADACRAQAFAAQGRLREAAAAFDAGARGAETVRDPAAARLWAQTGNAWLATGEPAKARAALDAALASGTLTGLDRGEATLDRARALVAGGDLKAARIDMDSALKDAADDPLAWLLSAALARRMGDLTRAKTDIAGALLRSADDASVQLEAGNIAAADGDGDRARAAWSAAQRLAPDTPAGRSAAQALTQFPAQVDAKEGR